MKKRTRNGLIGEDASKSVMRDALDETSSSRKYEQKCDVKLIPKEIRVTKFHKKAADEKEFVIPADEEKSLKK